MAKCAICEKGVHYGNNVSHSHRRSNRQKLYVCASCLRSGKVERA